MFSNIDSKDSPKKEGLSFVYLKSFCNFASVKNENLLSNNKK